MKPVIFPFFIFSFSLFATSMGIPADDALPLFSIGTDGGMGAYIRLPFEKQDVFYESNYWSGPGFSRIGRHWLHPGENHDVARSFCAPRNGRAVLKGKVAKLHLDGDGVVAVIFCNEKELWRKEIDGTDSVGTEYAIDIELKKGDCVRFQLNRRGHHFCDTTGWEPTIVYLDGNKESYSAVEGFSDEQGRNGWFYEILEKPGSTPLPKLNVHLSDESAYRELLAGIPRLPEFEMFPLLLAEWLDEDRFRRMFPVIPWEYAHLWVARPEGQEDAPPLHEMTRDALLRCVEDQLERCYSLIEDYHARFGIDFSVENDLLTKLRRESSGKDCSLDEIQRLYVRARFLKRSLLLANPEFARDEFLFLKRFPSPYSHQVGQYFGWWQRPGGDGPGGGLYILEKPGFSLKTRGPLNRQLPNGVIVEPRLSYDAKRIVFSFVEPPKSPLNGASLPINEEGNDEFYFHLYEMNVDGTGLRQLTNAKYDDLMPEYLPDGGLAFVSTRRKGYLRCAGEGFGKRWHSFTLFRMNASLTGTNGESLLNSDDIQQISFNDVNEWFPAVSNSGHLLFARWDYIDRDAVTHQNLWAMRPDGTNPVALWGNASPLPLCMFQAKPIPESNKFVFIAAAHHSITGGPVCLVDPAVSVNSLDAITRITPGTFPEAENWYTPEYYNAPFPFSERLFLVSYAPNRLVFEPHTNTDNALGLYLLDDRGNRELLYRDPIIGSTNPIPMVARPIPPIIPTLIDSELAAKGLGEMSLINVYEGLGSDVKRGSLKKLRIVQVFPKTTVVVNQPQIGTGGEENTRAILGVVPIEEDGSAKFLVPSGVPFFFQVLDEEGFAYQTMRSSTSVMPGERISCAGCHEDQRYAASRPQTHPIAFLKPAALMTATPESGRPYGFVEMVQPILDAKCVSCHNEDKPEGGYDLSRRLVEHRQTYSWAPISYTVHGYTASYSALCRDKELVPCYLERNQIQQTEPGGKIGANGSGLIRLLKNKHAGVELTPYEMERIGTWIDMNAVYYGAYDEEMIQRQQRGEPIPMPKRQ